MCVHNKHYNNSNNMRIQAYRAQLKRINDDDADDRYAVALGSRAVPASVNYWRKLYKFAILLRA